MAGGRNTPIIAGIFFLLVLMFAVPVSADTITIDNSSTIADALLNVAAGGTIILQPDMIYFETDVALTKDITIRANTSAGGSAANTIIDAESSGRIFDAGSYSLTIEDLTLRNGKASSGSGGAINSGETVTVTGSTFTNCSAGVAGGAIYDDGGTVNITSSTFTGCSGSYSGGAIFCSGGTLNVTSSVFTSCSSPVTGNGNGGAIACSSGSTANVISSTFTGCSASSYGGAVYSYDDITVTGSTFTGCMAVSSGGAIYSYRGIVTVTDSTFTDCPAVQAGAIYSNSGITVTRTTFTNCSAVANGGAILSYRDNDITVTDSTFTDCSAEYGGAIYGPTGDVSAYSSSFINCSSENGAAIFSDNGSSVTISGSDFTDCTSLYQGTLTLLNAGNAVAISSSNFTGCSATSASGGAIYSVGNDITVSGSTFTGCSANVYGGAILASDNTLTVESSTFSGCSAAYSGGAIIAAGSTVEMHYSRIFDSNTGTAIVNSRGNFSATNNWWGTNDDPSSNYTSGGILADPWLVLGVTASPSSITTSQTSAVRANLTHNSDGDDTSGSGYVPDGITATFAVTGGSGSVSPSSGTTTGGAVATTFTPSALGDATVSAAIDGVTVTVPVTVQVSSSGGSSSSSSGSGGGSNTDTGIGYAEGLKAGENITFEMDKGAVYLVSFTAETGIKQLMITVRKESSVPSSIGSPDGTVYEYEDVGLYYTDNSGLSGKTFGFKVKKSWLTENGYSSGDIVMLHYNEETGEWEELPTTLTGEDGTYYYYSAETPSFSWFAIAVPGDTTIVQKSISASATKAATAVSTATQSSTADSVFVDGDTGIPVGSEEPGEQESGISPVIPVLFVVLVIIVVAGFATRKKKEEYPDWWDKELK